MFELRTSSSKCNESPVSQASAALCSCEQWPTLSRSQPHIPTLSQSAPHPPTPLPSAPINLPYFIVAQSSGHLPPPPAPRLRTSHPNTLITIAIYSPSALARTGGEHNTFNEFDESVEDHHTEQRAENSDERGQKCDGGDLAS
jgi:hypothetical protein